MVTLTSWLETIPLKRIGDLTDIRMSGFQKDLVSGRFLCEVSALKFGCRISTTITIESCDVVAEQKQTVLDTVTTALRAALQQLEDRELFRPPQFTLLKGGSA